MRTALLVAIVAVAMTGGCNRKKKSSEVDASKYREVTLEILGMT